MMKTRFTKDSMPDNYDELHSHYGIQGYRVLALGYKKINKIKQSDIKKLDRDGIESDLLFSGFLVFGCPLKPTSKSSILALKNSSHAVVMITGDHVLTACAVASQLRICIREVIILYLNSETDEFYFSDVYNKSKIPFVKTDKDYLDIIKKYDICLSGKTLAQLISAEKSGKISYKEICCLVRHCRVFARFSPTQKEYILTCFKDENLTTLMCGDGTNDVGALKQAHVGVALISSEQANAHRAIQANKYARKHRHQIKR
eukprot:UN30321